MSVSWQDSQTPQCVSKKSPAEDEGKEENTATRRGLKKPRLVTVPSNLVYCQVLLHGTV